jgi:hypothetical protein
VRNIEKKRKLLCHFIQIYKCWVKRIRWKWKGKKKFFLSWQYDCRSSRFNWIARLLRSFWVRNVKKFPFFSFSYLYVLLYNLHIERDTQHQLSVIIIILWNGWKKWNEMGRRLKQANRYRQERSTEKVHLKINKMSFDFLIFILMAISASQLFSSISAWWKFFFLPFRPIFLIVAVSMWLIETVQIDRYVDGTMRQYKRNEYNKILVWEGGNWKNIIKKEDSKERAYHQILRNQIIGIWTKRQIKLNCLLWETVKKRNFILQEDTISTYTSSAWALMTIDCFRGIFGYAAHLAPLS